MGWLFQWDVTLAANGGSFQVDREYSLAPVPEPATMVLFGAGLAGLALARSRKKRNKV